MKSSILIAYFSTMFAITNPVGNASIFIGLTADNSIDEQRKIAIKAAVSALVILIVVTLVGADILHFFGVNAAALESAGGLIILIMGLHMLQAKSSPVHMGDDDHAHAQAKEDIAVVPLALPLIAGPGAMSTVIVYVSKYSTIADKMSIVMINVLVAALVGFFLYLAPFVKRYLGPSGIGIVTRVMGMILMAMAFMMLSSGLAVLFPGLA